MIRRAWICILLLVGLAVPLHAQSAVNSPRAWIPAGYAGFVSLNTERLNSTITSLSMASLVETLLQPTRPSFTPVQSLDDLFPLTRLDVSGATFANTILPWIGDELVVVYRQFDGGLRVAEDDMVLLLPARDALLAVQTLSPVIQAQDLLERESYRDALLYRGDKVDFAITPDAVLIGSEAHLRAILDVKAGEGERLIDQPGYLPVTRPMPESAQVIAYFDGAVALQTLSFLLDGDDSAVPLLAALGESLRAARGDSAFEALILSDSLDAIGLSLGADTVRFGSVRATLTFYASDQPEPESAPVFNPAVLEFIPQNAIIMQNGADTAGAVYNVLYALPLTNFAGQILGAFPVAESAGAASGRWPQPTADDLQRVVGDFLRVLTQVADFDMKANLLDQLPGSYALALLPRPNNPTPIFNTPYDVLLVAEVDDSETALESLRFLVRVIMGFSMTETTEYQNIPFSSITLPDGQHVLTMCVVDDMLLVATGDALQPALNARRGDNQLIRRDRWESIGRDGQPELYLDFAGFYNTFLPQAGGATIRSVNQLGARTVYVGEGVYQIQVLVTLAGEIG